MRNYINNPWDFFHLQNFRLDFFLEREELFFKKNKPVFIKKINNKVYKSSLFFPIDFKKKNLSTEKLLCNFLIRGGNFFKIRSHLRKAQAILFNALLFNPSITLKKKYDFFETLGHIVALGNRWIIFSNLLSYFLKKTESMFFLKKISTRKHYKRKKKIFKLNPHIIFLCILPLHKQRNYSIREFSLYIKSIKRFSLSDRILLASMNLFLLDKQTFLYRKKILCYKRVLRQYLEQNVR